MSFLLDTHAFLWFVSGDNQLPASVRDIIRDIHQPCFLSAVSKLPNHHSYPFDRLIISQAIAENLVIITRDKGFKKYMVEQLWN